MEATAKALQRFELGRRLTADLLRQFKLVTTIVLSLSVGLMIWHMQPPSPLDTKAVHFLATLCVAVILWIFDVLEDYLVALILLLSWRLFDIIPTKLALSGFSTGSWFFLVGALGLGAAITISGLPRRLAFSVLRRIPLHQFGTLTFCLSAIGLLITPLMPTGKVRATLMVPIARAVSEEAGFKPRSNGSAVLALSAYIGFAQMSFLFLTGGAHNLVGWNLLSEAAKADFGWAMWTLASLPAGIFTLCFLLLVTRLAMPLTDDDRSWISSKASERKTEFVGPLSKAEWLSILVLAFTLFGWLGEPLHGIGETWVAIAALVVFMSTGCLDKNSLMTKIDWGFLLFFGISYSLAPISSELKVDLWLVKIMEPLLLSVSYNPLTFLMTVVVLVYIVNLFLKKAPAVVLLIFTLNPWAENLGVHPGVLLVTISLAIQGFFLPYQDGPYQLAYFSADKNSFSHKQGTTLLVAKFFASFIAIAISVPYWKLLGFIR